MIRGNQCLFLDAEMLLECLPASRGHIDGAQWFYATYPSFVAKQVREMRTERTGKMMLPFRPIEALPGKAAPGRFDLRHVQSHEREPFLTGWRDLELLVGCRDEEASFLQAMRDSDTEAPRQVVVATAGELQIPRFPRQGLSTHGL
jgi:hypothetical protein